MLELTPAVAGASQCGTGNAACPCVGSFGGFNVSNFEGSAGLVVRLSGVPYNYGVSYGLHSCSAHDRGAPPYCNVPGAPSWCSMLWCYVNASSCGVSNSPSSYVADAVGLHYSYETCDSEDTFTTAYTQREGVVRLCSVFAEDSVTGAPCGTTSTHEQVEAMVRAVNSLNDGRGFEMQSGLLTRHYTFSYSYATYHAGEWETVGRRLSEDTFGGGDCDVVVGMGVGCPDADLVAQALVANATRRIYLTGRGPQAVLTAGGTHQPYLFSTHVRSDTYADVSLLRFARLGATSYALLYEADAADADADADADAAAAAGHNYTGDHFYRGLGERIVEYASELQLERRHVSTVTRGPAADGTATADLAALEEQLLAAHATRADVLLLVVRTEEFGRALQVLKAARPPAAGGHTYRALWWQGVGVPSNDFDFDCDGFAEECDYATGAAQMGAVEQASGHEDAILQMTHEQMLRASSDANGASGGARRLDLVSASAAAGLPDGAMIPSTIAQAMTTIFRFREVSSPALPLTDPLDYELLRSYLRSGDAVAATFYGPVRFSARTGQNEGKPPTTMQMRGGVARVVLPVDLQVLLPLPSGASAPPFRCLYPSRRSAGGLRLPLPGARRRLPGRRRPRALRRRRRLRPVRGDDVRRVGGGERDADGRARRRGPRAAGGAARRGALLPPLALAAAAAAHDGQAAAAQDPAVVRVAPLPLAHVGERAGPVRAHQARAAHVPADGARLPRRRRPRGRRRARAVRVAVGGDADVPQQRLLQIDQLPARGARVGRGPHARRRRRSSMQQQHGRL